MARYSLDYLESLPTLCEGWNVDLKIETGNKRVWLTRTTVADGEPYNNKVIVERLIKNSWTTVKEYQAK